MNTAHDTQARVHKFNDDEAVRRAFENRRLMGRILGNRWPIPEEWLDYTDWMEAERQARPVRAIGMPIERQ